MNRREFHLSTLFSAIEWLNHEVKETVESRTNEHLTPSHWQLSRILTRAVVRDSQQSMAVH